MDQVYLKLLVGKEPFQSLTEFVCEKLEIHTVIPAHGDIVRGKEMIWTMLREHFIFQHMVISVG